jgi:hypothetical protein
VQRPGPAHLGERDAAGLAALEADLGAVIVGAQHQRKLPAGGCRPGGQRFGREPGRPVRAGIDVADRAAPAAMAAVVGDQPVAQRLVGGRLQLRIEAGAHRQAGFVEPLVAIAGE